MKKLILALGLIGFMGVNDDGCESSTVMPATDSAGRCKDVAYSVGSGAWQIQCPDGYTMEAVGGTNRNGGVIICRCPTQPTPAHGAARGRDLSSSGQ